MLEPNTIPREEPLIRVGIVLPEDDQQQLTCHIPTDPVYELKSGQHESQKIAAGAQIEFKRENEQVTVISNNELLGRAKQWQLIPGSMRAGMQTRAGIRVEDVVSGRQFHWKKLIGVYLTGILEISVTQNSLLLVNELPLEHYLMCVATSEMGAACPDALIESQTIVARSWMLANVEMKHRHLGFDVCNDDCCQRYQGTTFLSDLSIQGALSTYGKVLMYAGRICDARYSKSCGGVMETFEKVWGGKPLPYMQPLPDAPPEFDDSALPLNSEEKVNAWITKVPETFCSPHFIPEEKLKQYLGSVDEEDNYFRWKFSYSQSEITALLNKKLKLEAEAITALDPLERGYSGRVIRLKISYRRKGQTESKIIKDQYEIRRCLHSAFLYSAAFIVDCDQAEIPEEFVLRGAGWGHGAGYCQIGALGMALQGYSATDIVNHYFPETELQNIYQ